MVCEQSTNDDVSGSNLEMKAAWIRLKLTEVLSKSQSSSVQIFNFVVGVVNDLEEAVLNVIPADNDLTEPVKGVFDTYRRTLKRQSSVHKNQSFVKKNFKCMVRLCHFKYTRR